MDKKEFPISKTQEQWKAELNADAYRVLREHGTEPPFANEYNDHKGQGTWRRVQSPRD